MAVIGLATVTTLRPQRAAAGALELGLAGVAVILCGLAAAGIFIAVWRLRQAGVLRDIAVRTMTISAMIFGTIIGASVFALVFRGLGGDAHIEALITAMPGGPDGALFFVMALIFVIGFFLDFVEISVIILPIVAPALILLGLDPVWLSVLIAINLQTSFLTPPFGFSLFYLRGAAPPEITTGEIYRGVAPYIGLQIVGLFWCGACRRWPRPCRAPCSVEVRRGLVGSRRQLDRTGHTGAGQAAIAERVLGQILLVVGLGEIERPGLGDLGGDAAATVGSERLLVGIPGAQRRGALGFGCPVDGRAVLRAGIVALAHALRRVVRFPEHLEEVAIGHHVGLKDHHHRLGMAGHAAAHLLIGGIGRDPSHVAHRGDPNARNLPEPSLGAPVAAEREIGDVATRRVGAVKRTAGHDVTLRSGDRPVAARQGLGGIGKLERLAAEQTHGRAPLRQISLVLLIWRGSGARTRAKWGCGCTAGRDHYIAGPSP
jgi:hypothetical protein